MVARFYFNHPDDGPTEITDRIDRMVPWSLQERAEEGMPGSNSIILADPEMDLDITGHRRAWVIEDESEATDDVLWYGWVGFQKVSRGQGDDLQITARRWSVEFLDFNAVWNRRVIQASSAERDPETDVERADWLLGLATSGIFDDVTTYFHTGSTVAMDEGNYLGQYRDQVMDDCAQASGKNWWAKGHETGSGRETFVWYGHDGETDYVSDLFLSNDPADWDDAALAGGYSDVFPISEDTELYRDPSRQYSGVYLEYEGGAVYRTKSATIDDIGRRDFVAPARMVKTKTKAEARANRYLNKLDTQDEVIRTRIRVPNAKATKLRAGMRVRFKATHLPGYDDEFYWTRCLSCTVRPVEVGQYDLDLELITDGVGAGDEVPFQGSAIAALIGWDSSSNPAVTDQSFLYTGDNAAGGYAGLPTIGPLTPVEGDEVTLGITADEAMTVRISAECWLAGVVSAFESATLNIRVNGVVVGSHNQTITPGGVESWNAQFAVDLRNVALEAGDVVTMDTVVANDGFLGGFGDNSTVKNSSMLIVGRGSHTNLPSGSDYGTNWTGP